MFCGSLIQVLEYNLSWFHLITADFDYHNLGYRRIQSGKRWDHYPACFAKTRNVPLLRVCREIQQKLFAKEGSVIILDGMFFHRSGFNNSGGRRRTCQGMYSLPFMGQQISIPKTLKDKYCNDPFLRHLLGYNSIQQDSVFDWRKEKLDNKRKKLRKVMLEEWYGESVSV